MRAVTWLFGSGVFSVMDWTELLFSLRSSRRDFINTRALRMNNIQRMNVRWVVCSSYCALNAFLSSVSVDIVCYTISWSNKSIWGMLVRSSADLEIVIALSSNDRLCDRALVFICFWRCCRCLMACSLNFSISEIAISAGLRFSRF